jgi:protein TonB
MGYQALLFSPDEKLARIVSQVFTELDFTVDPAHDPFGAVKKLMTQHYDAIVVDCDNEQNASLLFKSARNSSSNYSSLAIALVEGQAGVAKAYRIGANLVLTKPINVEQTKGTLRVARGLLRKHSDAAGGSATSGVIPTMPARAASASAGSSSPWVRQGDAAIAPPPSYPELPETEAQLPAIIPDALPAAFADGFPAGFPAEFPAEFPAITASAKVEYKPAVPTPAAPIRTTRADEPDLPARQSSSPAVKNEAGNAGIVKGIVKNEAARIASASLSTQNVSSAFASPGSAAAPAPAREVTAPPARKNKQENKKVGWVPSNRSHDAAPMLSSVSATNNSSFSALSEKEDSGGSGGNQKILIAAVIVVALAALGYLGYGTLGKSSTSTPAPQTVSTIQDSAERDSGKQDSEPAPVPDPMSTPKVAPSPDTLNRASSTTQTSAPKPAAAISPDMPSRGAGNPPAMRIALDLGLETKKTNATPLLVKSDPEGIKAQAQSQDSAPPLLSPLALTSAAGTSGAGTSNDNALRSLMSSASSSLPKPSLATARVSQGVSQGLLIKRVQPIYPQAALAMHAHGAVQIEATIDKEGNVTNLKVLSGDPILAHAALEAVREWRYKPYYLDAKPVEIQTQITVNFKAN